MYPAIKYASWLALCGALVCTAVPAHAAPVFSGKVSSSLDQVTGNVKVCFRETGLPAKPTTYTVKASVTAAYACRNRGGNCPPGQDTTIKQTAAIPATYTPDKYGSVTACVYLKVPRAGTSPCPDEMALVLKSVSWAGISVSDVSNTIGPIHANPAKQVVNYGACPAR